MKHAIPWLGLSLLFIVVDQITKQMAVSHLEYNDPVYVLPVFNIVLHYNYGAAFSFLSDAGGWQRWFFTVLSSVVSVILLVWITRIAATQKLLTAALALVLAGAIGNLWDRVTLGYVVDFIQVHWGENYFPTFNVADSVITIGAGLMLLDMVLNPESKDDEY